MHVVEVRVGAHARAALDVPTIIPGFFDQVEAVVPGVDEPHLGVRLPRRLELLRLRLHRVVRLARVAGVRVELDVVRARKVVARDRVDTAAAHAVEVSFATYHETLALDRVAVLVERVDKVADRRFDVVLAARNCITRRARLVDRVLHHHAELLLVARVGRGLAAVDAVRSPPAADLLQEKKREVKTWHLCT